MITSLGLFILMATSALKLNSTVTRRNSLAEFATTTALMATLAATAAPKLSEMSEGTKEEKSMNEISKIIRLAGIFYNYTATTEGRGRFPGQSSFNVPVGGASSSYSDADSTGAAATANSKSTHERAILADLDGWKMFDENHNSVWASVFGTTSVDNPENPLPDAAKGVIDNPQGSADFKTLMGDKALNSQFQDGHYVYAVVAGGGSGKSVYPPVLYVADIENAADFNNVLEP